LIRILPYHYIHVLDRNTNVTRLEIGPQNFIKKDHENITSGSSPQRYIILQPYHYCLINNPVIRDDKGELVYDKHGQVKVNIGESEYRTLDGYPEPFPLYPCEEFAKGDILTVIPRDQALKIEALRDFTDENGTKRIAGDEWHEFGPKIYIPRVEAKISVRVEPITISTNSAIRIKA